MKHMLNTLYVTNPKSSLSKEGETLVVEQEGNKVLQLPMHAVGQLICFGFTVYVTPPLMEACAEKGIGIVWLSESGKFLGRVEGPVHGNVLLRRDQYRIADDHGGALAVAKCITAAKLNNSRLNLQRFLRNKPECIDKDRFGIQIDRLARLIMDTENVKDMDSLRGIEGEAANRYFDLFDGMIVQQKDDFVFKTRTRRPPLDRVNAMLSFSYTLLVHDVRSALESVGLDPYVGFLHTDRPGRPSLALDLMEEFRAPFADRLVLSLINLKQIQKSDFEIIGTGETLMTADGRKKFIIAYQNRKKETVVHPFLGETVEIGLVFLMQARLLARFLRGDMEFYPAFIWK